MITPLQHWAKKLRTAADAIDAVFELTPTPAIANRMLASIRVTGPKAGWHYGGTHWTQRPENRLKVKRAVRHMQRAKKASR